MSDAYSSDAPTALVAMSTKKLLFIILFGALAGVATWGLTIALDAYVYKAILCNSDTVVQCASSYQYATTTATIIGAAVGLFGLVKLQVFRPLLIVIASFVSLWGLISLLASFSWYVALIAAVGLYAAAFGVFGWFARIRKFYIAIILVILMVVAVRLILNS
jgi:hypothetical protein